MAFSEIIILGAGAVGSAFGALLSRQNKVLLVGRKEHVKAINQQGLQVIGHIEETFSLKAATKLESIPEKALLLLTTKSFDAASSLEEIKPLLKADTTILTLQNGLGIKEEIKAKTGLDILQGFTYTGAIFLEPGKIFLSPLRGKTFIEPSKKAEAIKQLLEEADFKTEVPENFRERQWEKFIINCVLNPLTAIFGVENNMIVQPSLDPVKKSIIDECLDVAKAEGVNLETDFLAHINIFFASSQNKSSMLQDLEKGRKTEIKYLNGKIVELAEKHGLKALTNQKIVKQIERLEKD
jgi:2-dehydropantoate 2-reductase